jgi:hypothetical protein
MRDWIVTNCSSRLWKIAWLEQRSVAVNNKVNTKFIENRVVRLVKRDRRFDDLASRYYADINAYLEERLAPECLAICQKIQGKLPRELRDNIYEFSIGMKRSCMDTDFSTNEDPDTEKI